MTSVGDKQSLQCPDGETEAEAPLIFGKRGASHQLLQFIHLPHEDAFQAVTQCLDNTKTQEWQAAGSPGHRAPSTPDILWEHPPPPLREGVLGSGVCSPSLLMCLAQKGSFLAPGLFSLPRGSSGVQQRRRQPRGLRTWKQGPRRGVVVLCSPYKGAWAHRGALSRRAVWR